MVMAIIAILIGGVIVTTGGITGGAEIQKCTSELQRLEALLLGYKSLAGRYPTTEQGLEALVTKPSTTPIPRRWVSTLKTLPKDPWGNDYHYSMPGSKSPNGFEIISNGPDGEAGTDDDISSEDVSE